MTDAEIPGAIELWVGLLGLAALVAIVVRRLRVPYTVALVIAGLLVGLAAGAAGFPPIDVSPDLVLLVLLPGLVFEAAYRLRIAELRRWIGGLVLLAIPGVLISAAIVAVVLTLATGLPIGLSFIVGAMVSATDPAAVVATFKRLRVPPALSTMVDGESLLNDGTGLVLFALAVQAVAAPLGPGEAIVSFVATIVLSLAIGLGTGYLAARAIGLVDDHLIELTISVVLAYGSYIVADQLHLSGVIATVTAAVVLGNLGPGRLMSATGEDAIDIVWEFVAYLLTAVVFLEVGLAISPGRLLDSIGPIAWAIGAILVGRAVDRLRPARRGLTSHPTPRVGGTRPSRVAPCPLLVGSARGGRGRHGPVTAGRYPAARPAPGDHLWRRPLHPAGPGHDRRRADRSGDPPRCGAGIDDGPGAGGATGLNGHRLGAASAGGTARAGRTPRSSPTCAGPSSAGSRRSPGDSCARSERDRATRCIRDRGEPPRPATSPRSARS